MLEWLASVDRSVFLFLNVTLENPVTNWVMPIITEDDFLRIGYALALVLMLWRGNAKLRWLVIFSGVTLLLTDQISAGLLKDWIGRPRPCQIMENINLLVGCGGGKAMPSAHAANSFGQAALYSYHYQRVRWPLLTFAALVAISRVFVGVHYPGDILVGAALGAIIGLTLALAYEQFDRRIRRRGNSDRGQTG